MGRLGKLFVELGWKSSEFDKGISSAQAKTKGFSANASAALGSVAARFLSVAAAVKVLGDGVRTMKDFERANSTLASVLGKSSDGIKELTQAAVDLGKSTMYTASQVTELQTALARLGFDQSQILDMQEGVLKFAAAVGTDLGSAADFTGSALRAFGLESKDTTALLDVMAASTSKSALSFAKLQTSISIVAPVANAFGLSAADTVALLGALSNAGFDASSAATAFRNILLNLADSNGALAKGLGHTAKTFPEIIDALKECDSKGIDLNTTLQMTDKRSVSAFSSLIKGADDVKALRLELDKANGSLETMYSTMTDNLQGAIDELKSAWEGLMLTMRNSTGVLADAGRGLADFLNFYSDVFSGKGGYEAITNLSNTKFQRAVNKTIKTNADAGTGTQEAYQAGIDKLSAEIRAINAQINGGKVVNEFQLAQLAAKLKNLNGQRSVLMGAMEQLYGSAPVDNSNNAVLNGSGSASASGAATAGFSPEEWEDYLKKIKEDTAAIGEEAAALVEEEREYAELSDKLYQQFRDAHNLPPIQIIDQDILHTADMGFQDWLDSLEKIEKEAEKINRQFELLDELTLGSIQNDLDNQQDAIIKSLTGFNGAVEKQSYDIGDLISGVLTSAVNDFSGAMDTMFEALVSAEDIDSSALTAALLTPLCDIAKQMGEVIMTMALASIELEANIAANPYLVLAAGAALVAIGAAGKAALSSIAKGNGTATTTTGTSMAAATTSSAELTVYVKGTIKGSDILISGQNTMNEWSK